MIRCPHLGLNKNYTLRFKSCLYVVKVSLIQRFFEQKEQTNWSVLESYQGKNKSHPFEVIHVTDIA